MGPYVCYCVIIHMHGNASRHFVSAGAVDESLLTTSESHIRLRKCQLRPTMFVALPFDVLCILISLVDWETLRSIIRVHPCLRAAFLTRLYSTLRIGQPHIHGFFNMFPLEHCDAVIHLDIFPWHYVPPPSAALTLSRFTKLRSLELCLNFS